VAKYLKELKTRIPSMEAEIKELTDELG